jgi:hypothetical protein
MSHQAIVALVGQSGLDTIAMNNNAGVGYTAWAPIGGLNCINSAQGGTGAGACPTITQLQSTLSNTGAFTASQTTCRMSWSGALAAEIDMGLIINGSAGQIILKILTHAVLGRDYVAGDLVQDLTHTDAISAGVPACFTFGYSGSGLTAASEAVWTGVECLATSTGAASVPFATSPSSAHGTGGKGSYFYGFPGVTGTVDNGPNNAYGVGQVKVPTAGTWSNLQLYIIPPLPGGGTSTNANLQSCVNAAYVTASGQQNPPGISDGQQNIAIKGNVPVGLLQDNTHTDAVAANNFINYGVALVQGNPNVYFSALGSTWTSTDPDTVPMTACGDINPAVSGTQYAEIISTSPRPGPGTVETSSIATVGGTFSGLNVITYANSGTGTFKWYINNPAGNQAGGPTGNQTGTLSAVLGGVVQDLSHTDVIVAGQAFANSFTGLSNFQMSAQSIAFRAGATPISASIFESNDGLRQGSIEAVTGTALTYNGDWEALFDQAGIAPGPFNGRMLAWLNIQLSASYTSLPAAQEAFALSQGAPNWSSMGSFTA